MFGTSQSCQVADPALTEPTTGELSRKAGLRVFSAPIIAHGIDKGASQAAGAAPTLRYGPAGDSAPRLRLRRPGMPERFPFGPSTRPECPGEFGDGSVSWFDVDLRLHYLLAPTVSLKEFFDCLPCPGRCCRLRSDRLYNLVNIDIYRNT